MQLRIDAHEDPRLRRAGGCAFNVLNALARMVAREAGADGSLAPRWCDLETITRWACEENQSDVHDAIASLLVEGALTGSLAVGLTIEPDLWADYANERLRKRLGREREAKQASATGTGPAPCCSTCRDGMHYHPNGDYAKCCECPRGREIARLVYAVREGERESEARKADDVGRRGGGPRAIQETLKGMGGRRRRAAGDEGG